MKPNKINKQISIGVHSTHILSINRHAFNLYRSNAKIPLVYLWAGISGIKWRKKNGRYMGCWLLGCWLHGQISFKRKTETQQFFIRHKQCAHKMINTIKSVYDVGGLLREKKKATTIKSAIAANYVNITTVYTHGDPLQPYMHLRIEFFHFRFDWLIDSPLGCFHAFFSNHVNLLSSASAIIRIFYGSFKKYIQTIQCKGSWRKSLSNSKMPCSTLSK